MNGLLGFFLLAFAPGLWADDPCAQFRARAKLIADPLAQPQLFASYDQNPDRLQRDVWSRETRAGLSFDLARFSQGSAIRDLAEKECELWRKRTSLTQRTSGALKALTVKALESKRKVYTAVTEELEREVAGVNANGTLEHQDQLEKYILQQKTLIAGVDEQILRLSMDDVEAQSFSPALNFETEIQQLEQEYRSYEAERARAHRLNRSNLVLTGGTVQREVPGAAGDRLPYFFGVELRVPISDLMLGSRERAVASGPDNLTTDSYFENLKLWLVSFKAERKRLTLLSDLFQERVRNIEKRLRVVRRDGGAQFSSLARALKVQLAEMQAELAYNNVMLATAAAAETVKPAAGETARIKLMATEGTLFEGKDGLGIYQVKDERLRAKAVESKASRLEMTFKFEGKSAVTKNLKSGKSRVQLGCYLAAKNQCNLLYAMWRVEPEPGIFVQLKSNPGQSTHAECENDGYATVKPTFQKKMAAPVPNRSYRYLCELSGNTLTVKIDQEKVWSGVVDLKLLDPNGYSGVRSDNAVWEFGVTGENSNR